MSVIVVKHEGEYLVRLFDLLEMLTRKGWEFDVEVNDRSTKVNVFPPAKYTKKGAN